jgi:hypothetical protein
MSDNAVHAYCDSGCDPEREHKGLHCDIEGHSMLDSVPFRIYK